ncbi:hypothetical protein [Microbacterium sp.]|uniref:hypothetical protein n=2 Tax=Microbacterium sp. TaxID=51671 RepID=UPI00092BC307|nr:hypothetical protein [Microbacterium sp.]OJU61368.1 MAG: hypothetical protein BGO04_10760 [Microbacterium sp. 70-38]
MLIDASGGVNGLDTRGCTESDRARRSRRVEVPTLQDNPFAHSCCRTHDRRVMSLHYTSGTVLMADDVCEALLRYAQALASSQGSDVVTVPIIDPEREDAMAEFLLGPASQLFATPEPDGPTTSSHPDVVAELYRRTRATLPTALPEDSNPVAVDWDLELG